MSCDCATAFQPGEQSKTASQKNKHKKESPKLFGLSLNYSLGPSTNNQLWEPTWGVCLGGEGLAKAAVSPALRQAVCGLCQGLGAAVSSLQRLGQNLILASRWAGLGGFLPSL